MKKTLIIFICLTGLVQVGAITESNDQIISYGNNKFQNIEKRLPKLECSQFHKYRGLLQNSYLFFEKMKIGRVAFMGGSITEGHGWRDSIMSFLQRKFPETIFEFIQAGIPSMGSTPGAFRLEHDVLKLGKIDLFFEEAAVNDRGNGASDTEQIRAMEGIIRHIRLVYPACDIVMMHFADPGKIADYRKGIIPAEIRNHEKVAEHYQVSSINLAREVTSRIDAGEFSWEKDFVDLHPSPFGHNIYYQSIKSFLENCWRGIPVTTDSLINHPLPEKLDKYCYDKGKLIPLTDVKASKGWLYVNDWTPKDTMPAREGFVHVPMLVSELPGENISLDFTGKGVGIVVVAGPDAGTIEFRIDHGKWDTLSLQTPWSYRVHLPWYYVLRDNLKVKNHTLKLRLVSGKLTTQNTACRIRYFFINE